MSQDALKSSALSKVHSLLLSWRASMQIHRTPKLWMQYQRMVQILRSFIRSVRTGNWTLYLQCLSDMLPYLAAAGHNNYTKSLAIFIPKMMDLQCTHRDVHAAFMRGLFPVRRTDGAWTGMFTDLFIESVLMAGLKSTGGLTRGRGFNESTRLLFLLSRPICAEISQSIFEIAGLSSDEEDGHREQTASRIQRDMSDTDKVLQVLLERGVFSTSSRKLVSLSTGLVGDDNVNADEAKAVGDKILESMVDQPVGSYTFSQKRRVKTLASAAYVKTSTGERIEIDPKHLYQRLLIMGVGEIPLVDLLQYELCSFPASLFDNQLFMRSGDKAELIHHLVKLVPECIISSLPKGLQYVIDGGGLLHKFSWPKHSTYAEICAMYTQHITRSYDIALVVFDGYHGPSTKDETHRKRTGNDVGASVSVSSEMRLTMSKKAFLSNERNKQALINLLSQEMSKSGISVEHAEVDADYKICKMACASAVRQLTAVVAEDTDVFQLLTHYASPTDFNLYMITAKQNVCITTLSKRLDPLLTKNLLFLHAVSGCDTTSRPFGIGKVGVLKKYAALENSASTFMSPTSSKSDIEKEGERTLLIMYGCATASSLSSARFDRFQAKVASSAGYVPPEKLPPTVDAGRFHSLRTYHQVQTWRGNNLPPENWGWSASPSGLVPFKMSKEAAPEQLLRTIRCNCGGKCDRKSCTCLKNGLLCTTACGQCKGVSCLNVQADSSDNEDIDANDDAAD